jgi:hypothetical protein
LINTFNGKLEKILTRIDTNFKPRQEINNILFESVAPIFWCGNFKGSGNCCYNHWLGLPEKNGTKHPIYKYQSEITGKLESHKHIWILKARGLGITELFLRWIEWYCYTNLQSQPTQVILLTGVNLKLAKDLINRMKHHLQDFSHDMYQVRIGNYTIKAYPSNHVQAYRGQENVKIIFGDEAAHFTILNDLECRAVIEGYIARIDGKRVILEKGK